MAEENDKAVFDPSKKPAEEPENTTEADRTCKSQEKDFSAVRGNLFRFFFEAWISRIFCQPLSTVDASHVQTQFFEKASALRDAGGLHPDYHPDGFDIDFEQVQGRKCGRLRVVVKKKSYLDLVAYLVEEISREAVRGTFKSYTKAEVDENRREIVVAR